MRRCTISLAEDEGAEAGNEQEEDSADRRRQRLRNDNTGQERQQPVPRFAPAAGDQGMPRQSAVIGITLATDVAKKGT